MINLNHKYALLEDGSIEPLQYYDGEPRDAYMDYNGNYYLNYDVYDVVANVRFKILHKRSQIIRTSNNRNELGV